MLAVPGLGREDKEIGHLSGGQEAEITFAFSIVWWNGCWCLKIWFGDKMMSILDMWNLSCLWNIAAICKFVNTQLLVYFLFLHESKDDVCLVCCCNQCLAWCLTYNRHSINIWMNELNGCGWKWPKGHLQLGAENRNLIITKIATIYWMLTMCWANTSNVLAHSVLKTILRDIVIPMETEIWKAQSHI